MAGTPAFSEAEHGVVRRIADAEYDLAERRAAAAIPSEIVAQLDTEDDILAAAVRLTRRTPVAPPARDEQRT